MQFQDIVAKGYHLKQVSQIQKDKNHIVFLIYKLLIYNVPLFVCPSECVCACECARRKLITFFANFKNDEKNESELLVLTLVSKPSFKKVFLHDPQTSIKKGS